MKRLHRSRRVAAFALLALIVPLLLAACGGSEVAPAATTAATTASGAATAVAPTVAAAATTVTGAATNAAPTVNAASTTVTGAATSAAAPAAAKGGQLVVGVSFADFLTFDPMHFYEINPTPIHAGAYEPLVAQNPPDITKFVPVLAKELPAVSADGKEYTFKLRDNVKFHTGNTMTADDWVFSLGRLHNLQDNPSFLADPYSTKDKVNVVAVDKMTLKITLTDPNVAFLSFLATAPAVVIDSKAVKEKGGTDAADAKDKDKAKDYLDQNSAGTGPFIIKSFKQKEEVVIDKNPNYWREGAKLDRIIWKAVEGSGQQRQQLEAGTIDIAEGLDVDAVADLQKGGKFTIVTGNTLNHTYLALNTDKDAGGVLADKRVRQAIGYAIDYNGIIKGLLKDQAVQPPTVVPQGLLGVDKVTPKYKTDLNMAKDLVKQANAVGQTVKFTIPAATSYDGITTEVWAAKLKADIEQTGLKVEIVPVEAQQRLADYRAAKLQFTISSWSPDYADVHTYAEPFSKTGGAAAKRVKYSNPDVDKLLEQGLKESDTAKRADIYVKIQNQIMEDAAFLVLDQPKAQIVMKKSVTGYTFHPVYLFVPYDLAKTA